MQEHIYFLPSPPMRQGKGQILSKAWGFAMNCHGLKKLSVVFGLWQILLSKFYYVHFFTFKRMNLWFGHESLV